MASPLPIDAWEIRLPAFGNDTLFDPSTSAAEVIQLDSIGRPLQVIQLHRTSIGWAPATKTKAQFDALGNLITLDSWTFEKDQWENQSKTIRTLDGNGHEIAFEMMVWEDSEWHSTYRKTAVDAAETLSAKLMP